MTIQHPWLSIYPILINWKTSNNYLNHVHVVTHCEEEEEEEEEEDIEKSTMQIASNKELKVEV